MAGRRVDPYPQAESLARTFLKDDVQLASSRQFMASEGLVVFAAGKEGIAGAASRVWLRPSAYRRAGHYLDLRMNPSVCGFRIARRPVRGQLTELVPVDLFEQFKTAAEQTKNAIIDGDRGIQLRWCGESENDGWDWEACVQYENVLKLADGQRIVADANVQIYGRPGPGDTVDVAVVITREGDLEVASAWINRAAGSTHGWEAAPVGMSEDDLVAELRRIQDAFTEKHAKVLAWSNPHFDRQIGVETDEVSDRFVAGMRGAKYDTEWYELDTIASRGSADAAAITHLQVIVHEAHTRRGVNKDRPEPVIALRFSQRMTSPNLRIHWHRGRVLTSDQREIPLTRGVWESLSALDWDADAKRDYMLRRWSQVIAALDASDSDATAVDEDGPSASSEAAG